MYCIAYIATLGCEKIREIASSEPVAIRFVNDNNKKMVNNNYLYLLYNCNSFLIDLQQTIEPLIAFSLESLLESLSISYSEHKAPNYPFVEC